MDDLNQLFGRLAAGVRGRGAWVYHVFADVVFDDLSNKAFERPAARRGLLQHTRAFAVLFDSALDGLNLPLQALEPVEQFLLFLLYMPHRGLNSFP